MADCFLGEIRIFGGNYAPLGWSTCNGQSLSIGQNDALFSLLYITYGGDGVSYFNLPDLRGRVPVHMGTGPGMTPRSIGQQVGSEQQALDSGTLAAHSHGLAGSLSAVSSNDPNGKLPGTGKGDSKVYTTAGGDVVGMNAGSVTSAGSGQAHNNMMPSLCLNFIISLEGIYPTRD